MIVRVTDTLQASLDHPEDFCHFSVQIENAITGLDDAQRALCKKSRFWKTERQLGSK